MRWKNMMEKSYNDVGRDGRGVYMSPEDVDYVDKNPEGLTKEGVEESLKLWKTCKNKYVRTKYEVMLKVCKNLQKSGRTTEGGRIFARDPKTNKITWAERLNRETQHLVQDLKPELEEEESAEESKGET